MRTIGVLLGVSMTAATGCLTLSTTDKSTTGSGGMGGTGMGESSSTSSGGPAGAGGMMSSTSSSGSSSSNSSSSSGAGGMASSSSSGGGGAGGGCVSNMPCNTGKLGICAAGLMSCDVPMVCVQTLQPSPEKCTSGNEDENCDGNTNCTGDTKVGAAYGDVGIQRGRDVAVDSSGNVYVTGYFAGSVDFGGGVLAAAGGNDIFVAKFDRKGEHQWSKRFGDAGEQQARAIAVDNNDEIFIVGAIDGSVVFGNTTLNSAASGPDAFIAKLDSDGNPLWAKYAQAAGIQAFEDVATDSSGNAVAVGVLQGTANFGSGMIGSGEDDVLVVKYSKDGATSWSRAFGTIANYESANAVDIDATGAIYLAGTTTGATNFGNGPITFGGATDAFVAKLNAQGTAVWSKGFGDAKAQAGIDIATDTANNVIFSMTFGGTINLGGQMFTAAGTNIDYALAKFDGAGQHLWSKNLKATVDKGGAVIDTDGAGNIVAAASFSGAIDFGTGATISMGIDMAFAKLDPSGTALYTRTFGTAGSVVSPYGIAGAYLGDVWVTGTYSGTVNFGTGALNASTSDMFLAGFAP